MFEVSPLRMNAGTQTPSPVVDSSINNALLQTNPDLKQSLLEYVYILERRLIDSLLHDSQNW